MVVGDEGRSKGEKTEDCLNLLSDQGYHFYEIVNGDLCLVQNGTPSRKTANILTTHRFF